MLSCAVLMAACSGTSTRKPEIVPIDVTAAAALGVVEKDVGRFAGCDWPALLAEHEPTDYDQQIEQLLTNSDQSVSCPAMRKACDLGPTLRAHGLPEQAAAWTGFCAQAERCKAIELKLASHVHEIDRQGLDTLWVKQGSEALALEAHVRQYRHSKPQLYAAYEGLLTARKTRAELECRHKTDYLYRMATTADRLLKGHQNAARYIEEQLSRLPQDPDTALALFLPASKAYDRLVVAHKDYAAIVDSGGFSTLSAKVVGLKFGRKGDSVVALRSRLASERLLAVAGAGVEDFDGSVGDAVMQFQRLHLLSATGRIDRDTFKALAISADDKLKAIRIALDTYRRAVGPWEPTFLYVQVPHAFLELYVNTQFVRLFKTIVGQATRTKDPETKTREFSRRTMPLNSAVTRVMLHPEWNVPDSIAREELEPRLVKDPGYLGRNGYTIFRYKGGKQRYIQAPGPGNALGKVKFQFKNSHGYYLHDTPAHKKRLFKKRYRLLSHGCVRIQDALKLALLLLSNDQGVTWDSFRQELADEKSTTYTLLTPIPLHIAYSTAAADSHGRLFFAPDYYELESPQP